MRKEFEKKGELAGLFGIQNKDEKLRGIIGAIHQTFDKKGELKISENTLVTLISLVAISGPEEKEAMVNLIINLIK